MSVVFKKTTATGSWLRPKAGPAGSAWPVLAGPCQLAVASTRAMGEGARSIQRILRCQHALAAMVLKQDNVGRPRLVLGRDVSGQLADVRHDGRSVDITGVHEGRVPRAHLPRRRQVAPQIRSDTSGGDSSEAEACTSLTRPASS